MHLPRGSPIRILAEPSRCTPVSQEFNSRLNGAKSVLFLYKISGGLTGPFDINTGLNFLTKSNVEPFLHTKSRYKGNSSEEKVLERSGAIAS